MHRARQPVLIAVRGLDPVGTGRQAELLARGLAAQGRDVHVAITSTGGSLAARLRDAGLPVHAIGRRPVPDVAATLRLLGLARRLRAAALLTLGRRQAAMAGGRSRKKKWSKGKLKEKLANSVMFDKAG
jgi:choline dehydrogenase-like flavoprotein